MIRPARPEDVDAIAELYERSFGTLTFLPTLHTLEEHRGCFGRVVDDREVWVWDEDDVVLGFIALDDAMVDYLYVEPRVTGRGIGSALLQHAKQQRRGGFSLWTFQQNEGARRFYERHGLRVVRLTEGEDNEEKTPDALYAWRPPRSTLALNRRVTGGRFLSLSERNLPSPALSAPRRSAPFRRSR